MNIEIRALVDSILQREQITARVTQPDTNAGLQFSLVPCAAERYRIQFYE